MNAIMTATNKLEAAESVEAEARQRLHYLRTQKLGRYHELIAPAEEALRAAERAAREQCAGEFDAAIETALKAVDVAARAAGDARAEASREWCATQFYPVGARVRKWGPSGYYRDGAWRPTDEIAEVQIYRDGDPVPENLSRWSTPNDGAVILRTVKKGGALGLKFVSHPSDLKRKYWLPESAERYPTNQQEGVSP